MWRAYHAPVRAYIYRRVSDWHLAEDLTSQVFVKALDAQRRGLGAVQHLSGWLYRIAHNLVIDYYRERSRAVQEDLEKAVTQPSRELSPHEHAVTGELEARVRSALQQLNERQRAAVALRLDGYTDAEMAQQIQINLGAAKALLHRGRTNLWELLESERDEEVQISPRTP